MKEFDLQDTFLLSKIIDKMELKMEADKLARTIKTEKLENKDDVMKLGKDVLLTIGLEFVTKMVANLHKADKEVIQLISNLSEKKIESVQSMKLKDLKQFFIDLVKTEGFNDFFSPGETSDQPQQEMSSLSDTATSDIS